MMTHHAWRFIEAAGLIGAVVIVCGLIAAIAIDLVQPKEWRR
jgi:hypothetical protein